MSEVSDKPQKQPVWQQTAQGCGILFVIACILIYANWEEFSDFLKSLLWPLVIIGIVLFVLSFFLIRFLMRRQRHSPRRFKRWHIIKRLVAYRVDPQKLSNAVENIDQLDELDTKVEH